jgi:hypothetical protein
LILRVRIFRYVRTPGADYPHLLGSRCYISRLENHLERIHLDLFPQHAHVVSFVFGDTHAQLCEMSRTYTSECIVTPAYSSLVRVPLQAEMTFLHVRSKRWHTGTTWLPQDLTKVR